MIIKHQHKMADLEQVIKINNSGDMMEYATWSCFDRYCDYHEYRYVELPTLEIIGVGIDDEA